MLSRMKIIEEINECNLIPLSEDELFGIRGGGDSNDDEPAKRNSECNTGANTDKCNECGTKVICLKINKCTSCGKS